jgi:hypothetical protein
MFVFFGLYFVSHVVRARKSHRRRSRRRFVSKSLPTSSSQCWWDPPWRIKEYDWHSGDRAFVIWSTLVFFCLVICLVLLSCGCVCVCVGVCVCGWVCFCFCYKHERERERVFVCFLLCIILCSSAFFPRHWFAGKPMGFIGPKDGVVGGVEPRVEEVTDGQAS